MRWPSRVPRPRPDIEHPPFEEEQADTSEIRIKELSKRGGGRPGLPVPNSQYGLYESKATFEDEEDTSELLSCVKVHMDVLGSPSLIVSTISVAVKQHLKKTKKTLQRSGSRGCLKQEVDVLGSPSLIVRTVSVNVRQHLKKKKTL